MPSLPSEREASVSADALAEIDRLCDRFEAGWIAGSRSALDDVLAQSPIELREALFRELLSLELALRQQAGETCNEQQYTERYPHRSEAIRDVFRSQETSRRPSRQYSTPSAFDTRAGQAASAEACQASPHALPALIGKYRVVAWLGGGGQGEVYRAIHPTLNRDVVIKIGHRTVDDQAASAARLIHEGQALASLDDRHLVRVFDFDFHERRPYLVMDFVRGQSLRQRLADGPLPAREAARLAAQVARALATVHRHGRVHLDVKPDNVMVDDQGEAYLVDFGLAVLGDLWSESQPIEGQFRGTPAFAASEQAAGQVDRIGPRTDVFAVGALLYSLVTGNVPYEGTQLATVLEAARRGRFDRDRLRRMAPPRLAAIVLRAMSVDPAARFESAEAMAAALEAFVQWRAGRTIAAAAGGVLAAAALVFAAVAFWPRDEGLDSSASPIAPIEGMDQPDGPPAAPLATIPQWDRATGEIRLDGEVIRRVRNLQQATNIVPLLDALEANGWPSRMQSPFGPDFTAHRLHATVQSLNENLTRIRFRADGLNMEVRWNRVADGEDESIGTP